MKKIGYFTLMLLVAAYVAFAEFKGTKTATQLLNTPNDSDVFIGILLMIFVLANAVFGIVIIKQMINRSKED